MNRRTFLLGSATAAGALSAQTTTDKIRTAVIGTGNRGSYLLEGVLLQPGATVVALSDIKPDRLDKAAPPRARQPENLFRLACHDRPQRHRCCVHRHSAVSPRGIAIAAQEAVRHDLLRETDRHHARAGPLDSRCRARVETGVHGRPAASVDTNLQGRCAGTSMTAC